MRHGQTFLVTVLFFSLIAGPLAAQDEDRGGKRNPQSRDAVLDNLFRLPQGVELTDQQKEKLDELRKQRGAEYADKLQEIQAKLNGVFTREQLNDRRAAYSAARDAGKNEREARAAGEVAVKLSDEQQKQLASLRAEQQALIVSVRREIIKILGRDRPNRRGGGPRIPPTHANVKYGPHERNVLDFWQAKSDKPTPVLVSIHGGGFRGGNKSVSGPLLQQCLDEGISVAAITYRFSQHAIAPASFTDSARAVQFIRAKAAEWNVAPARFAATGGSAGAGISLWLGFHGDMADPDSDDPVLRQSTRMSCMFVYNGQTSYDPRFIRELFPESDTYKHSALAQLFGVDLDQLDDLPDEKYRLFEEVSAIPHLSKDDPPVILTYNSALDAPISNQSAGIHHPRFGKALKQRMDALGIQCEVQAGGETIGGGPPTSPIDLMKRQFGMVE